MKLIWAAVTFAAAVVLFTVTAVSAATAPSVSYLVVSKAMRITIDANPSHYYVRSWVQCKNAAGTVTKNSVGPWKRSVDASSETGPCGSSSHVSSAGKQWDKTHLYKATCYTPGRSTSGFC